jgi:hypothetical protein
VLDWCRVTCGAGGDASGGQEIRHETFGFAVSYRGQIFAPPPMRLGFRSQRTKRTSGLGGSGGEVLCRLHDSLHHGLVCIHSDGWQCIGGEDGAKLGLQRTVAYVSPDRRDSLPRPDLRVSQTAADG